VHPEPELRAIERRGKDVVATDRAQGDERVGAGATRLSEHEFQLAHLVAAVPSAGGVVALDPDVGVDALGDAGQRMHGRRQRGELDPRQRRQLGPSFEQDAHG
jgi:hypothetical protein